MTFNPTIGNILRLAFTINSNSLSRYNELCNNKCSMRIKTDKDKYEILNSLCLKLLLENGLNKTKQLTIVIQILPKNEMESHLALDSIYMPKSVLDNNFTLLLNESESILMGVDQSECDSNTDVI